MKRTLIDKTSFSLAYGTKTIISVDVYMPTLRMEEVVWDQNTAQLRLAQDKSKERRKQAAIRIAT